MLNNSYEIDIMLLIFLHINYNYLLFIFHMIYDNTHLMKLNVSFSHALTEFNLHRKELRVIITFQLSVVFSIIHITISTVTSINFIFQ